LAKQTVLAALLKIRVGVGIVGILGIVEGIGIVGSFLDLADVTRVGGAGTLELAWGTLKSLLDTGLEKLELIWVLFDVVGHSKEFLETMALGRIGVTIADGTRGSIRNGTGGISGSFRSKLVDKEIDSGFQVVVEVSFFREGDVTGFTVGVTMSITVAVAVAVGGGVTITIGSLGAPEGFLGDGLGGTRKVEVILHGGANKFG
jgi:hypothetical protein